MKLPRMTGNPTPIVDPPEPIREPPALAQNSEGSRHNEVVRISLQWEGSSSASATGYEKSASAGGRA